MVRYEKADPPRLPLVVEMLDEIFVQSRGRSGSFGLRYPSCYCLENLGHIWVAMDKERPVASAAAKTREVVLPGGRRHVVGIVGGVATFTGFRGRGLGSGVMQHLENALRDEGVDALVLWTGIQSFYVKHGWITRDAGRLGRLVAPLQFDPGVVRRMTMDDEQSIRLVESIRREKSDYYIERLSLDYRTIPMPAEKVSWFFMEDGSSRAYAAAGAVADQDYLYEVQGDTSLFGSLLASVHGTMPSLAINDHPVTDFGKWATSLGIARWEKKPLGMWKSLRKGLDVNELADHLFISMMDRI